MRCQRRRHAATQHGWDTERATDQLADLYLLTSQGVTSSTDRNAEAEDREHRELVDLLADRAAAYRRLVHYATTTGQEIAP